MIVTLPSLNPIPDDIQEHITRLLQQPADPAIGVWLLELIKNSGHMSNADDMRWRVLCLIWLAMEYDTDQAWPYVMWLNMNEPVISSHLSEILIEAVDDYDAHVKMANWQARSTDERLVEFLKDFRCIPAQRKMEPLMSNLVSQPAQPETGVWLAKFCKDTAYNDPAYMRSWRLLAAAWYAAAFNPIEGLAYLQTLTNGASILSAADNKLLMDTASKINGLPAMIQMVADCPDPIVKTLLRDFGHPDLPALAQTILDSEPDYSYLEGASQHALANVELFKHNLEYLEKAGILPKIANLLDLACGPLVTHTALLSSVGYKILGVDLDIPPGYLPLPSKKAWFKRNKHAKAWKLAAAPYFHALEQQADIKLKRDKFNIKLADLTRLDAAANSFDAVICANYLHHAPDVNSLLAEAARVLKPGGLFLANIQPYSAYTGALEAASPLPWGHLQNEEPPTSARPLNKWREAQFKQILKKHFTLDQWLPKTDINAQAQLTPELEAQLNPYTPEELTRKQILVVARK